MVCLPGRDARRSGSRKVCRNRDEAPPRAPLLTKEKVLRSIDVRDETSHAEQRVHVLRPDQGEGPSVLLRLWITSDSAAAARLGDPAEVTITLLPTPNYRVDAHLEWLTARALAYRILRLTDEMAYQSRDT